MIKKYRFSPAERYAVWHCNGHRCWLCNEPLRFFETTIDHVLPESLLASDQLQATAFNYYGLDKDFNINGFENWAPCHAHCNQRKGGSITLMPGNRITLDRLKANAPKAVRVAADIESNKAKDEILGKVFAALEQNTITISDLRILFRNLTAESAPVILPDNMILLNSGYWVFKEDVVREGVCTCERSACVESDTKIYCYFPPKLSYWVIKKGLYWKCYDEIIICPRCSNSHKRGHIGRAGICGHPYLNQDSQTD